MIVTQSDRPRPFLRVRGRTFMAFALVPEAPLDAWLPVLDAQLERSPAFFEGRPVVIDVTLLQPTDDGLPGLADALRARGVQVIGTEGLGADWPDVTEWGWPPLLAGGRGEGTVEAPEPPPPEPPSLLVEEHVRSGQSVLFPAGDVIVVGSVGWGAEVIAGGSVHIYGTLRGRAIAGLNGDRRARIFCRRLEAELLAIDGIYKTAEDMAPGLHGRPAQAALVNDTIIIAAMD
jgi:septum site-determining protein MinC